MPTITYKRIWCKTCNNFTLHTDFRDNKTCCTICKTEYSDVLLKDIPKEKILEQRQRYKEYKKQKFSKMLNRYLNPIPDFLIEMMSEVGSNSCIIESDAGQKFIDDEQEKKDKIKREERRIEREKELEEIEKYKHLGRNDKCLCGSNLKYKHCCFKRISSY